MTSLNRYPGITARRPLVAAHARDAILLAFCYVALDWASYIYPLGPFNITPWNPPPALAIVWMLLGGLRFAPTVFGAIFASDLLILHLPGGWALSVLTSLLLAGGYTTIVIVLRQVFSFDGTLREARQLWILVGVTAPGTALTGLAYVGALYIAGFYIADTFARAALQFWIGDMVGILVTTPLLLVAADRVDRARFLEAWRKPETALQFAVLTGLVFLMFTSTKNPQDYFYVLFLPLIWIALRNGLPGAALASGLTQIGVVLGAQGGALQSLDVVELQALVLAFTLTGLALGIVVDERERAVEKAKRSLRLGAATEMAGAIAHEINQPLAALHNYGSALQDVIAGIGDVARDREINVIVEKMLTESRRAADVVKRLRDLFRSGAMQLEMVRIDALLKSAEAMARKLNERREVAVTIQNEVGARMLLIDRMQIEVVLRNLLANAFEAVARLPAGKKHVSIAVRRLTKGRILFEVCDSGEGISPLVRQRLFEPFVSDKVSGMGLGLSICRTIAEAHGGSLTAANGAHGRFELVLPSKEAHE